MSRYYLGYDTEEDEPATTAEHVAFFAALLPGLALLVVFIVAFIVAVLR